MTEYLKCEKCNKIFAERVSTGSGIGGMPAWYRPSGEGPCPHCFGEVRWVSDIGMSFNPYNEIKNFSTPMKIIWICILIIALFALIVSWLS